jgi:Ca2+/Na+ antiporter
MDAEEQKELRKKIVVLLPVVFLVLVLIFFVPAGTFGYWEAWVYCAVLLVPFLFVLTWLFRTNPELLARRLRLNERESAQRRIVSASGVLFVTGLLIPGLDHRYGWIPWRTVCLHVPFFFFPAGRCDEEQDEKVIVPHFPGRR